VIHRFFRMACFIALLPLIGACTLALDVPKLQTMTPTGSPFTQELAAGYRGLSQEQASEYDWTSAEVFAKKALRSANGEAVLPELPIDWYNRMGDSSIQSAYLELMDVRAKLVTKLDGGARDSDAVRAARAQVAYDCWVEEASEPNSGDDLARCRNTVLAFLAPTMAAMQSAKSSEVATPQVYLVFFAFDRSDISPVSVQVLDRLIEDFHRTGSARLDTQGYTDLSGSIEYNVKLSHRRADAVKRYLLAHGVKESEIQTEWFGKTHPRVPTPDGVRNQENRRAEIYLKK
jgi:OOP family OmpA-OmpF porin